MRRKGLITLCIAAAAVLANYIPLINTHSEQDNCAFGPVSNDQYRGYLSLAKASIRTTSAKHFQSELNRLFGSITGGETSIYPRIATMHATLRTFGAEYRNTNGFDVDDWGRSDPFLKAATQNPSCDT